MKNRTVFGVVLLCALSFAGSSSCTVTTPPTTQTVLTVFHTNDIHSHVRAAKTDPFGLGGMAKISTLLKSLRQTTPLSMTLDAGDYSEGTMYFNVDAGANMLKMMGVMGYDAACLGNHDFLIGPDQIINTMHNAGTPFPVMAANLDMSAYSNAAALQAVLPPTTIKTVGGLKIGLIGLTTYELFYNTYMDPVAITDAVAAATKYATQLRPNVDVLIVISHNDFTMNQLIAQNVPGIDALISGHTHLKVPQAVMVANAGRQIPVVETGAWGQFVGDLKLSVTPRNGSTAAIVQFNAYQLHPVTPDIVDDPQIAQMVTAQDQALETKYGEDVTNKVIAQSSFDLLQQDDTESALGNLAVKAYRAATGADLSLEEISLTGVSIAKGPTTVMDAHDVVPHIYNPATGKEWELRIWNAKGSDLALVFNIFYTINGLMPLDSPTGWLSSDGATITWQASSPPKVNSITINGVPLDPAARYKVVISDGLLLALTQANSILGLGADLSEMTDSGMQASQSIINYVTQVGTLTPQSLGVGGHTMTQSQDLAVFNYSMAWDGTTLSVDVQNLGLQASGAGTLNCSTGLPNDLISYNTSLQKWTALPAQSLPVLRPGGAATINVPWNLAGLAKGYWPVQCVINSASDTYTSNNTAQKVFKL